MEASGVISSLVMISGCFPLLALLVRSNTGLWIMVEYLGELERRE